MKYTIIFFFALILSASTAIAQNAKNSNSENDLFRILGWTTYGVMAGDVVSTQIGLNRGFVEANPLQRNTAIRISSHVVVPILTNYATARLYEAGHRKTALWMRIAIVAGYGYVTAHNLRQH